MKNVIILISVLAMSPAAFANKNLELSCMFSSAGNATATNVTINDGMIDTVSCPSFVCNNQWEITMNYNGNGNGYEEITLSVENKVSGEMTQMTHQNVKVGYTFDFATFNKKTDKDFAIDCEVMKAN